MSNNDKYLDLPNYTPRSTGITSSPLVVALFGALNGITGLKAEINSRLNGDLEGFRKEAASLGFKLVGLDDNRRAFNVLATTIGQCTDERVGYQGKKLGLQTVKSKGQVTGVVCGYAKKRQVTKSKTLTKAMSATAAFIVEGREYGDVMDMLALFLEACDVDSTDLEVLATMI